MKFEVEMTDTFNGEANYAWVKRTTITTPEVVEESTLIRRAKAEMGISGVKCRREDIGDTIALYLRGAHVVVFITPQVD